MHTIALELEYCSEALHIEKRKESRVERCGNLTLVGELVFVSGTSPNSAG